MAAERDRRYTWPFQIRSCSTSGFTGDTNVPGKDLRSFRRQESPVTSPGGTLRCHPALRRSLLLSRPPPAEGKGKGQCVPTRSLHRSPTGGQASCGTPPLGSCSFPPGRHRSLKSFPDSLCGRTQGASRPPIPSE